MTTNPVTATSGTAETGGLTPRQSEVGKDAFLALLVTQLKNQNPLDPQDNGEFLTQLAQFTSLESLQEIQDDIAALRAAADLVAGAPDSTTSRPNGGA